MERLIASAIRATLLAVLVWLNVDDLGAWLGLVRIRLKWEEYVAKYEKKRPRGLMGGCMFKLDFDYELADAVSKGFDHLVADWEFLYSLRQAIKNWWDAAELLQQSDIHSFLGKINACDDEIRSYLLHGKKPFFNSPKKFFIILSECQRMIDALLKEEITGGSALENVSSILFRPSYSDSFIEWVRKNLNHILMDDNEDGSLGKHLGIMLDELKLIQEYLPQVKDWELSFMLDDNHAFVTHVRSVVGRIAFQSCDFWISREDTDIARVKALGLVNLQHQIDPSNPEFIKLILDFHHTVVLNPRQPHAVGHFFTYILNSCTNKDTGKRLMSLVTLSSTTLLRSHSAREDVQCLFAEIQVLVTEAALLHRARQEIKTVYLHSCSYMLSKICILETEFFLKEQLSTITSSLPFSNTKIVEFESVLKNLSSATTDLCQHKDTEYGKQSSVLIAQLDGEVQSLYESVQSKKITDSMMKHLLYQLVFKIVFFKAESFVSELSTSQTGESFLGNGKEEIESFMMELKYLKQVVSYQQARNLRDEEILLFQQIEAVVRRVSFLSYSFLPDNDKFTKFLLSLPDLLNKVKEIKAKLEEVSPPIPTSGFPKTFELGVFDFLGRTIRDALKYDTESIRPVNNLLKQAQSQLEKFESMFVKVSDSDFLRGDLNGICYHFMELAYKLEYAVDSIEVDGRLQHSLWLYHLLEDFRLINEQISKIPESSSAAELKFPFASEVPSNRMSKDTSPAVSEMSVDIVDEEKAIIDLLMRGSSRRDVVSIVGMPGIGKTTLAGKVYSSKNVVFNFPRRAWCNVSQVYSKRDLLLDLLSGLDGNLDKFDGMSNDDLLSKLRRCLLGSRFLIVLDDVWDTSAWDDIQISFPDDNNGSRILITSRLRDVHLAVNPGSDPHLIRSFSDGESWMLLEKKIFEGGNCPSQLLLVGKKIAEHCQGLPLAVVAVAGLLQKTEKTKDWWEKISDRISSQLMSDPSPENRCKEILELSYKHLPEYLKPCFLYMGVFLRDKEISVSKLMQFWLAEGFIQEKESKSLEVVAYDYLMELINRSLVIISKTRLGGEVKTFRLHDLFRDLCRSKARDDNFLHLVTRDDEPYASFPDSDYDMLFRRHRLDPVTFESYRLSIFLSRNHFIDSKPSGPITRSLLFFASADKEPRCPYEILFILKNFKFLRVLHLECINMGVSFPTEIGLMCKLRYLALSGYIQSIPPSIGNLWKLQTLVVRGFRGTVVLPSTIWGMTSLRQLHVNEHVSFEMEDDEDGGCSSCLENLVSFSTPLLFYGDKTIRLLRRFPNLLKMRCIFLEPWECAKLCNELPSLDFLSRLEILKITYHGKAVDSGEFILPPSLKKLTLSNFRLPWKHISRIGELPNLKVLKLLSGAFVGTIWEMKEDEFQELEFLKLEALNIGEWIASEDHLPSLKRLVVQKCKYLEEIPQDFACISTLELIEVQWCTKAVEESAEKIGELAEAINVVISYN